MHFMNYRKNVMSEIFKITNANYLENITKDNFTDRLYLTN